MREKAAQAVLEEVLLSAIDSARELRSSAQPGSYDSGQIMGYYSIISFAKEQAAIMEVEFADKTIAAFDPDNELLGAPKARQPA